MRFRQMGPDLLQDLGLGLSTDGPLTGHSGVAAGVGGGHRGPATIPQSGNVASLSGIQHAGHSSDPQPTGTLVFNASRSSDTNMSCLEW